MPAVGAPRETGRLVRWLKREGDTVTRGARLMEVETDKPAVETEAPVSGVLSRVTASPDDDIPVGQATALIVELSGRHLHGIQSRHVRRRPLHRHHQSAAMRHVVRVAPRVVPHGDGIAVRFMMTTTLSADHRVVDDAIGVRFPQRVR